MEEAKSRFLDQVAYKVTYDITCFVEQSMEDCLRTLVEAFALVVTVIFLFSGNLHATRISLIAVPVLLIGVFWIMLALGFSLDMVATMATVLAIAIVVDDAIVVVEAELQKPPTRARPRRASSRWARPRH